MWLERLFARLSVMYGRSFADLWDSVPVAAVKAEWVAALAPFTAAQLAWTLEACRREFDLAPTLPRFLRLAQQAPRPQTPALPAPAPDRSAQSANATRLAQSVTSRPDFDPMAWAQPPKSLHGWRLLIDGASDGSLPLAAILRGHVEHISGIPRELRTRAASVVEQVFGPRAAHD